MSIRKTWLNGSEEFHFIFVYKAVIGNNCNYSSAACECVSDPQRQRVSNKRKIEIDIAPKNQYKFETESQSSLKFVSVINFSEHLLL